MNTLLIDGNWLLKKNYHKRKNEEAKGEKCGGSYGFLDSLRSVLNKALPDRVVVMWDGLMSGYLRYEIYKPYKAKRKEYWKKELNAIATEGIESQEDKERVDFLNQKIVIKNFLEELLIRQVEVDYIEGDDLIAYYILNSKIPNEKITIYSRDRDFLQMISPNVSILSPDKLELITIHNFKSIYGYPIENALLLKCFDGDSADEIGGVSGVTPEKLLENFPRMTEERYTYNRLVEECYNKKREKKIKFFDKIIDARSILYRNAELMNLRKPFVNEMARQEIDSVTYKRLEAEKFSINSAMSLFIRKGFCKFVRNEQLDLFFAPFFTMINKEKEFSNNFKS